MKIPNENVSAFSIYSEKLKQKKKSKPLPLNGVHKMKKKPGKGKGNTLSLPALKEISDVVQALTKQSNNIDKHITSVSVNSNENVPDLSSNNKGQGKKKLYEELITQLKKSNNSGKLRQHVQNNNSIKPDEREKVTLKKMKKGKKKSNEENRESSVIQNINIKNKKHVQSNRVKAPNQDTEVILSNKEKGNRDTNDLLKGSDKSNHKTKSNPKIVKSILLIKEKQLKKNTTNLTKAGKKIKTKQCKEDNTKMESQSVSRNTFSNEETIKENSKLSENKTNLKLMKKKQKKLGNDNRISEGNSASEAKTVFESIINPVSEKDFMRNHWEKQLLLIQRKEHRNYFSELINTLEIDSMLRKNNVQFTKHLDVTSYTDQGRETHNLSGRAQANVVWDFYANGCSVRLLNPQAFLPKIHTLNAALQGYFGCFVGANVYLTPPNSQGFAPHYDDIEAFVLQIEGKKHWKVYHPRSVSETLPRYSSPNFTQEEIGEPILDVILEPGDMLYFPRGFIHQASTVEGEHSLHITLSAYQKTAWVDLLEKAIPIALERAAVEDIEFRQGLPRDYLNIEFHGDEKTKVSFAKTAQRLMSKVAHLLQYSLGAGVDRMGAQFMHDALPPVFTPEEKQNSSLGGGLKMKEKGKLIGGLEFELETEIKLVRANICRLVDEDGELRLYHCLDNSLEYHGQEPQFLVLPPEGADVITTLSTNYPNFTKIKTFHHTDEEALITLVSDLWDAGLLLVRNNPSVETD